MVRHIFEYTDGFCVYIKNTDDMVIFPYQTQKLTYEPWGDMVRHIFEYTDGFCVYIKNTDDRVMFSYQTFSPFFSHNKLITLW